MKILVTGASGFVGKNLCAALNAILGGKDKTRRDINVSAVFECDVDTTPLQLEEYCAEADFVFHFAACCRTETEADFDTVNVGFTELLLDALRRHGNNCPVLFTSSVQAALDNGYGKSKRRAEELVRRHGDETGASVLIYRLPRLFGKWCRPNYNSFVATLCYNAANGKPLAVDDPFSETELLYIDDLLSELLDALEGKAHRAGDFYAVPITHRTTYGNVAALLRRFSAQSVTPVVPDLPANSFEKKLFAAYLSYLPAERAKQPLKTITDSRGSFTELFKSASCGQISVNISEPDAVKGMHWHHSKCEAFAVVSGVALICQRCMADGREISFTVSGNDPQAVYILPGYTHSIKNLSKEERLVTIIWASEPFDDKHPDTFSE